MWAHERRLWQQGYALVAGVDEAGRGALAGPVVAAAVIFDPDVKIPGVRDSKLVSPDARCVLYRKIRAMARGVGVGIIDSDVIDERNILRATHAAMARALSRLAPPPEFTLIDGSPVKDVPFKHACIVKGDRKSYLIAAASIIAKVTRDSLMLDLALQYPGYGFEGHKGYGTADHRKAIETQGASPVHRKTFGPVARASAPKLPGFG